MKRRGFSALELTLAMAVLLLGAVATSQLILGAKLLGVAGQRRQLAISRADAVMEQLALLPWDLLLAAERGDVSLAEQLASAAEPAGQFEDNVFQIDVSELDDGLKGDPRPRKLTVVLTWAGDGRRPRAVKLTTVRYPPGQQPRLPPPGNSGEAAKGDSQ